MKAYKVFTRDLRSPLRGGEPVWGGKTPFKLPSVKVDRGNECASGWNACEKMSNALRIAGLWPNGKTSRVFLVDSGRRRVVSRGDKCRAASWTIERELSEDEIRKGVLDLSRGFGKFADEICDEQMLWREALARPLSEKEAVVAGLNKALSFRSLDWKLRVFDTPEAARDARGAWAAWAAWAAWDAWDAWDALAAWGARAARDARGAITVFYAAKNGWIDGDPHKLTIGIRDAYKNGLGIAVPIGNGELGWAMEES